MNKKFFILFFLSAFIIACTVAAKDSLVYKKTLTLDKIKNYNSDSLSFKQSLSSIMLKDTFGIVFNKEYTKQTHDSVFLERLTEMNLITEYNYAYNDIVLERIKRYCYKYRPYISKLLERGMYYFPIFEKKLDKYNLPLELKYVAVIESSLNPNALSRSGASGMWQFMYETGKWFDLDVTTYIDERKDPYKSTESACRYFEYLYNIFEDWELVLAAYNAGPGYIMRKLTTTGCEDYWCLRPFIRKETQNYIPKFIAISYMLNYYLDHEIAPRHYKYAVLQTDTFILNKSISFEAVSKYINLSQDSISMLNPVFKKGVIPVTKNNFNEIVLPRSYTNYFLLYKDSIYNYSSSLIEPYITQKSPVKYKVEKGDYLGKISKKYNCTVKDLIKWNDLKSTSISPGQKLIVYRPVIPKKDKKRNYAIYKVQPGDTLWDIAERNEGTTVDELIEINNLSNDSIYPGFKLKIPTKK